MIIYNNELYHYGIPRRSGRYKWGSGEDPYHHGQDGPKGFFRRKKKEESKKAEGQRGKEDIRERPTTKEDIINSGNPRLIKEHYKSLSNKDLKDAIDRINSLKTLDRLDMEAVNRGKKAIEERLNIAKKISDIAQPYIQMAVNYNKDTKKNEEFIKEVYKNVKRGSGHATVKKIYKRKG